jgi:hypothetical protein
MRRFLFVLCACGGASAEAPLTVQLGITHVAAEQALHAHQFCREPGQGDSNQELFPRCERTASEVSDSWVTAIFDGDKLVELRRWERFADDNRAVERWNELVAARAKASTPSEDALAQLRDKGLLQAGTRTVKAFRGDGEIVIGVYLLTPTAPEHANVLEKISYIKP